MKNFIEIARQLESELLSNNLAHEAQNFKRLTEEKCSSSVPICSIRAECAIDIIKQVSKTHRAEWKKLYAEKNEKVSAALERKMDCYKLGNPINVLK